LSKEPKQNPILAQSLEIRLWLEGKMREDLTNSEILAVFNEKFPFISGITAQNIASYRKKYTPEYKDLILERYGKKAKKSESEIENEILQEVREAEETDEEFNKEEKEKISMLRAHRVILKETWKNYKSVKNSKDEASKNKYLETAMKVLSAIRELESQEKSFVSIMGETRKAELKMSMDKYLDSIEGWFIPRMLERSTSKEQAVETIGKLHSYLDDYHKVITGSATLAEANLAMLTRLYVKEKTRKEEE
jgi:hypothetical protein